MKLAILMFSGVLWAQSGDLSPAPERERVRYRWSVITLAVANTADAATSWNLQEGNPLLAARDGQFGARSPLIKTGVVAGSMLAQRALARRNPVWRKRMVWVNFATAGALGVIAYRNAGLR